MFLEARLFCVSVLCVVSRGPARRPEGGGTGEWRRRLLRRGGVDPGGGETIRGRWRVWGGIPPAGGGGGVIQAGREGEREREGEGGGGELRHRGGRGSVAGGGACGGGAAQRA